MSQRSLAELIVFFMIIVMSCLSHIIGFIATDDYNLDFAVKIKFMGKG